MWSSNNVHSTGKEVLCFVVTTVQGAFSREFKNDPPHENKISLWFHKFEAKVVLYNRQDREGPKTSD
jgi:hypothetical protein